MTELEIENIAIELYQKNLLFLKENFFDIFQKIDCLSKEIEFGIYQEEYSLEFINGYFDIKNLKNNGFYYAVNSYKDSEERAKYNDFTSDSSWNLLHKDDNDKLVSFDTFHDVLPIVDYINEKIDINHLKFKKIMKMVFAGTGLGFHIHEIYKKLDPKTILIIEPNLELFRLSLFTLDYSFFQKKDKKLFLCVEDKEDKRRQSYAQFYSYQPYVNFNIKHYKLLKNNNYIIEELTDVFSKNEVISYTYKLLLKNLKLTVELARKKENFLSMNLLLEKKILKDKKVLLIGAGPSVDNYIDFIKENQSKLIIICVDIIVRKLEKYNIKPDILVSIDPLSIISEFLTTKDDNFLNDTAIVLMTQQHEETLKVVNKYHTYFAQSMRIFKHLGYLGTVPNVGTYATNFAFFAGTEEFYFIGNDAAFNQDTGERYAKDSPNYIKDSLETIESDKVSDYDVIEVEGNFRETVKTNRELYRFKTDFEAIISAYNMQEKKLYNLSDGVYIEGMEPLSKEDFSKILSNHPDENKDIIGQMNTVSTVVKTSDFSDDIVIINGILQRISKYRKKSYKDSNDFLKNKLDLMVWILEQSSKCDSNITRDLFLRFTELADVFVNLILNINQEDLEKKEEVNKVANLWISGLYNLFKDIKIILK